MEIGIVWPIFALVAWIYGVWFVMYVQRFALMRRTPPTREDFATMEAGKRYFSPVEMPAANLINLFEMPVLFFAIAPLLLITHHANHIQVALAWAFVGLRVLHSLVQIVVRRVPLRFMVYLASCAVLLAMWIGLFVDLAWPR
ncbi:MAG: MAPEG family protein [Alphaproteobacteria bacterium]|nr:MAG: MAPEG family protein [Alphaproteobacteria bacterium]